MAKIFWLASYPKSGNTWLRALLLNYLKDAEGTQSLDDLHGFALGDMDAQFYEKLLGRPVSTMSLAEMLPHRYAVHALIAKEAEGSPLVKTHSNYHMPDGSIAINRAVTRSAIYLVRNPLDMVISFGDHYGCGLDGAIEAAAASSHYIPPMPGRIAQHLGNWSSHVTGWVNSGDLPRLILRYEDLVRDPVRAFRQVVKFMKMDVDEARLKRAVERSSFKTLQAMEASEGFTEKSQNSDKFFRSGAFGKWRNTLSKKQVALVIKQHGKVMTKLGYLNEQGSPVF